MTVRGALPPSVAQRQTLRNGMSRVGAHPRSSAVLTCDRSTVILNIVSQ